MSVNVAKEHSILAFGVAPGCEGLPGLVEGSILELPFNIDTDVNACETGSSKDLHISSPDSGMIHPLLLDVLCSSEVPVVTLGVLTSAQVSVQEVVVPWIPDEAADHGPHHLMVFLCPCKGIGKRTKETVSIHSRVQRFGWPARRNSLPFTFGPVKSRLQDTLGSLGQSNSHVNCPIV